MSPWSVGARRASLAAVPRRPTDLGRMDRRCRGGGGHRVPRSAGGRGSTEGARARGVGRLTGDDWATAGAVAREIGIRHVFARVLPAEKAEKARLPRAQGRVVAMLGDGRCARAASRSRHRHRDRRGDVGGRDRHGGDGVDAPRGADPSGRGTRPRTTRGRRGQSPISRTRSRRSRWSGRSVR